MFYVSLKLCGHGFYELKNPFLLSLVIEVIKNNVASHPQKQIKGLSHNLRFQKESLTTNK